MDNDIYTWIDANNVEHILTKQPNVVVNNNQIGGFMPNFFFISDKVPFQPGSRLRNVNVEDREVDLPITILGANEAELRQNIRQFLNIFDPIRGDGRLRVTAPDGSQRELICRYSGGLEGHESDSLSKKLWKSFILVFHAFDPYWYSANAHVLQFTTGEPATFFPFFPLRLSSSQVFADTSINNDGDVETWPEWVITGPGENIVLRNLTTGKVISVNYILGEGETITIDTKPGKKTVKKNDGTNLYGSMAPDSSLWPLVKGNNSIRIEVANSTQDSLVQLTYYDRYMGV